MPKLQFLDQYCYFCRYYEVYDIMANTFFKFKQFIVRHDKCAMKVGTDGVLLGAWTNTDNCSNILDVGTGSGLIALMLAQKNDNATIDAIDIEETAYIQTKENIAESPFRDRIQTYHKSLSDYEAETAKKYDLIVSNPPYFIQSLHSPNQQRTTARHTDSLSLDSLITKSVRLLSEKGRISLILPSEQEKELNRIVEKEGLVFLRKTYIIPVPEAAPKRLMAELAIKTTSKRCITEKLTIEISRHQYSPEYIELTKDFYLNF